MSTGAARPTARFILYLIALGERRAMFRTWFRPYDTAAEMSGGTDRWLKASCSRSMSGSTS
jgi:hypothetical protein